MIILFAVAILFLLLVIFLICKKKKAAFKESTGTINEDDPLFYFKATKDETENLVTEAKFKCADMIECEGVSLKKDKSGVIGVGEKAISGGLTKFYKKQNHKSN